MNEQVKRYDYGYKDDGCGGARFLGLIEKPDGALVRHSDYDALHAEADALRVVLHEIASVNPAERGIEWAKSYASDGLKGAGSELYARWLETFKEAEALRAALSAQQSAHVSVPREWLDAVKELFDAKQAKEDFERENPGNSTKRWDACLYRIEAAEDALRALLNGG